MKKILLSALLLGGIYTAKAQAVNDSVSIGAGYANQLWYSLENGTQGSNPKTAWDLAFSTPTMEASIRINSAGGVKLWAYPGADTADWSTVDTAGLSTWTALYDADSAWYTTSFASAADTSNQFDYGWGDYNITTHSLYGNRIFIIKLTDGSYKKLIIESLTNTATLYKFKYADLDGTNQLEDSLSKTNYSNKTFGYYSLVNNAAVDQEPVTKPNWDLVFTQYTAYVNGITPYTVTGVLTNINDSTSQVYAPDTTTDYSSTPFSSNVNIIGYDWKNYSGGAYVVTDSTVYFVKDQNKSIWRLVFTGFSGSATGTYYFTKEKLYTVPTQDSSTSVNNLPNNVNSLVVYPNPTVNASSVNLIYDLNTINKNAVIQLVDMNGRILRTENLKYTSGFHNQTINISGLSKGLYIVNIISDNGQKQVKLSIN